MTEPEFDRGQRGVMVEDRTPLQRYGAAFGAVIIAFLVRFLMDTVLHEKHPFATFILATTLVAWYAGFVPSLAVFLTGFVLANWFFLPPRHEFAFFSPQNLGGNISTMFVGLSIIFFGRSMHLARRRAYANAREAIRHQKQLEQEVKERKRAEEAVRLLNADLEKRVEQRTAELVAANGELESFTYSVSHDLRAPLRHVDGYAQMLQEEFGGQLPAEAQRYLKKIRQGGQNMGRLVDDLLNLSHIGKASLNSRRAELKPIVEELINDLQSDFGPRHIEWQVGELPVLECDPGLVRQVFANLLGNAVKYTRPREQARIEVGQVQSQDETAIFVRDNGVGFNMKYGDKLFGVFQRLHRAEDFEGTGVGLATVARIVHKHGGRVWALGEVGKGASFYFTLGHQNGVDAADGQR